MAHSRKHFLTLSHKPRPQLPVSLLSILPPSPALLYVLAAPYKDTQVKYLGFIKSVCLSCNLVC